MKEMGKYCKAYPVEALKQFDGWTDSLQPVVRKTEQNGNEESGFDPGNYVFIHENFTVTRGIFLNEDIVLQNVTPEWIKFCKEILHFEVPDFDSRHARANDGKDNS
jgi:hypothetical protein